MLGAREILHVIDAHRDQCMDCRQMRPCEVGQKLERWSGERLAALMVPIPKEGSRE